MPQVVKVAEFMKSERDVFNKLVRAGIVSPTLIRQQEIYVYYCSLKSPSKMQRYEDTAQAMKSNLVSVMNAVKKMEKPI